MPTDQNKLDVKSQKNRAPFLPEVTSDSQKKAYAAFAKELAKHHPFDLPRVSYHIHSGLMPATKYEN
jgi:hypothetical protein